MLLKKVSLMIWYSSIKTLKEENRQLNFLFVTESPAILMNLSPKEELPMSAEIKYVLLYVKTISLSLQC